MVKLELILQFGSLTYLNEYQVFLFELNWNYKHLLEESYYTNVSIKKLTDEVYKKIKKEIL